MSISRSGLMAAALGAAAISGCGLGPGSSSKGTATLMVTRDYGTQQLASASESDPSESETVLRYLDRETDITTRYGGGFVQSINGISGQSGGARVQDWFFYRNGIESPVGSADVRVRGGDRIWWDYRDWTDAMRVPAVVGSFPQPFLESAGSGPTPIDCLAPAPACDDVAAGMKAAGLETETVDELRSAKVPRVVVGPWDAIRRDEAVAQIEAGPSTSGVFARFAGDSLQALDVQSEPARALGPDAGLVAAVRSGDDPPTWIVTGADVQGVEAAARLMRPADLESRYAVASEGGAPIALPVLGGSQ